eukprot:15119145-Ditylum_brightwellii.AAC.1
MQVSTGFYDGSHVTGHGACHPAITRLWEVAQHVATLPHYHNYWGTRVLQQSPAEMPVCPNRPSKTLQQL